MDKEREYFRDLEYNYFMKFGVKILKLHNGIELNHLKRINYIEYHCQHSEREIFDNRMFGFRIIIFKK